MKKTLAILVLLSVTLAFQISFSESEKPNYKTIRSKVLTDLAKAGEKMGNSSKKLETIALTIRGGDYADTAFYIHTVAEYLDSVSTILTLAFAITEEQLDLYFQLVHSHLLKTKKSVNSRLELVKINYARIENKAVLYEVDNANKVMIETVKLTDETIALLFAELLAE